MCTPFEMHNIFFVSLDLVFIYCNLMAFNNGHLQGFPYFSPFSVPPSINSHFFALMIFFFTWFCLYYIALFYRFHLMFAFLLLYAILGTFTKLRKATISFVMSVCPSVRMEQLGSH